MQTEIYIYTHTYTLFNEIYLSIHNTVELNVEPLNRYFFFLIPGNCFGRITSMYLFCALPLYSREHIYLAQSQGLLILGNV